MSIPSSISPKLERERTDPEDFLLFLTSNSTCSLILRCLLFLLVPFASDFTCCDSVCLHILLQWKMCVICGLQ